jgi:hypothetical protein
MNLDISFCEASKCEIKKDCHRWVDNMQLICKKQKVSLESRRISITDFSVIGDSCSYFIKLEKNEK